MKTKGLFLTGATGLVGSRVLARLAQTPKGEQAEPVYALSRQPPSSGEDARHVTWLSGDLLDVEQHSGALARCDRVLHLAACTGKARTSELERVNVAGTRALTRAAVAAGVPSIVHVSTIAAGFPEKRAYPYAATKERAEEVVRASGMSHVIARPTIVVGRDSPAWATIQSLARLPLVPLFGGGKARIQPIDVDDLARLLIRLSSAGFLASDPKLAGATIDMGGPEVLTFKELLGRAHERMCRGRARFVPVPLGPTIKTLSLLERVLFPVLPATAGQFYAFRYDSTARPHAFVERYGEDMLDVDAMLARYVG